MPKVIDALLKTHLVVMKLLDEAQADNPRFPETIKTLHRAVTAHTWFEETLFHPALRAKPGHDDELTRRLAEEHKQIDELLEEAQLVPAGEPEDAEIVISGLRAVLEAHLALEKDELYPLADQLLDAESQKALAEEMERRKSEVRDLVFP